MHSVENRAVSEPIFEIAKPMVHLHSNAIIFQIFAYKHFDRAWHTSGRQH